MSGDVETLIECEHARVRVLGSTAIVERGAVFEVWRGPFVFEVGEFFEVLGPRGPERPAGVGRVVSWLRLR